MMTKEFQPSQEQVRLAEALLVSMALEDTVRPIVEGYETAILERHQFHIDPKWVDLGGIADHVVLDRKRTFLLSERDARAFFAECVVARDAAGLKVDHPEDCPLLVAENLRLRAENALMKSLSSIPGLEAFASGLLPMETRKKVVDLALQLLAPYCEDSGTILHRYFRLEESVHLPGTWEEAGEGVYVRWNSGRTAFIEATIKERSIRLVAKVACTLGGFMNAVQALAETEVEMNGQADIDAAVQKMEEVIAVKI